MKKYLFTLFAAIILILAACGGGGSVEPDYNVVDFEKELNEGADLIGKTVEVEIIDIEPASAFGYNLQAGEHLNFVSSKNPELEVGDTFIAEVEEVESMLGSFIITYKKK